MPKVLFRVHTVLFLLDYILSRAEFRPSKISNNNRTILQTLEVFIANYQVFIGGDCGFV